MEKKQNSLENYYILSFLITPSVEETVVPVYSIGLKYNNLSYVKVTKKPKGKFRKTFLRKLDNTERIVLYS